MSISRWLKMDLHIHSWKSNETKSNDYSGNRYDVDKLISKLKSENINLFSITDHNILNIELYENLLDNKSKLIEENINFIIGVELDIQDSSIYGDKTFHALLFFKSYNIEIINQIIRELTKEGFPNMSDIFNIMNKHDERDFILIPHFNNKTKGLVNSKMERGAVDCLNAMIFDAYEDTNNIEKIQESLMVYSNHGYEDLPMLIFSDCHNIEVYPMYKKEDDKRPNFLSVLGNVEFPFNSLKLAFQDSKLRIGLDKIDGNKNYRIATKKNQMPYGIESIKINSSVIDFSEYQNTIIGGFGSGKSFLMKLLISGPEKLRESHSSEYGQLLDEIKSFNIVMSDGSSRNSLKEIHQNFEMIIFEQNERLYYENVIQEDEKNNLEEKLKIKFPELEPIDDMNFDRLDSYIKKYTSLKNKQLTDSLEYDLLEKREFYRVNRDADINSLEIESENMESIIELLNAEKEKEVFEQAIYSKDEQVKIEDVMKMIMSKNKKWKENTQTYNDMLKQLDKNIEKFNKEESENNSNIVSNIEIYEDIKEHIIQIGKSLKDLSKESIKVENELIEIKYIENKNKESIFEYGDYELITRYQCNKDYRNYQDSILKSAYRQHSFFNGIINTIKNNDNFHNNLDFKTNISNYYERNFYNDFSKFSYDIKKDKKSIMERSAGERANMILELIFSIIEESKDNKERILLIDQPEDHLDNKNIDSNIVQKIIKMKENNTLPQLILVTHNANVSISADSENIIIANKENNICKYKNSGIENDSFVADVCKILEGGPDALKRRGMKFSVSYVKEYLKKEI